MAESSKSTFENINDLIKAIAWPSIILLAFLSYKSEFNQIIELIPNKLESSSKISIGSLSFEIEKTANASGNAQLGRIIKNLSEKEIRKLLTLGESSQRMVYGTIGNNNQELYQLPTDIDLLTSLDKRGLIKSNGSISEFVEFFQSLHPDKKKLYRYKNGYSTSKLEPSSEEFFEYTIPVSRVSNASDRKRIENFNIELSDAGKKAFSIIVHVTAEQIKDN